MTLCDCVGVCVVLFSCSQSSHWSSCRSGQEGLKSKDLFELIYNKVQPQAVRVPASSGLKHCLIISLPVGANTSCEERIINTCEILCHAIVKV